MALNEAKEKVAQLENAIKRLDFVKKHLSRNASDIKREIHSCVSRNLECLRGREVALLSEVDEVLFIKEEALHQQQAHLNQALGVLQSGLTMMKDDSSTEKQLRETILKLNRMELSPGETPHIAFRADHVSLKESIMKYGRVDANGLSFAAFEDPDIPSASLPRHLEDYEDVDHHIFNKPVQEIDTGNSMSSITVTIPKLSNRMEDWLQKRVPSSKPSVTSSVLPLTKLNPCINSQSPSLKCGKESTLSCASTPSDACSLNNWLSLIKNHADLEEEHDFEIIDNSNGKEGTNMGTNAGRLSTSPDFFSHIEKDIRLWIRSACNGSDDAKEAKESNFFRHIPKETEVWLSKASQQLHSLEGTRETDFFNHISKQPSTWLRSRGHIKHQAAPSGSNQKAFAVEVFQSASKTDLSQWLVGNKPAQAPPNESKAEVEKDDFNIKGLKDQDKWLLKNSYSGCSSSNDFQLEEICRANELCASPSECLSQPNCAVFCQNNSSVKNAVDPQNAFKPLKLSIDKWLFPNTEKAEEATPDIFPAGHVSRNCQKQLTQVNLCAEEIVQPVANFKHNKEETNQWLRESHLLIQEPSHQTDDCDLFSVHSGSSISDWLMTPASSIDGKSLKERDQETEKESSEGWSLCSSPSSVNGDQFSKDVEIAADYIKKWIL